jgi:hypothetical protein
MVYASKPFSFRVLESLTWLTTSPTASRGGTPPLGAVCLIDEVQDILKGLKAFW